MSINDSTRLSSSVRLRAIGLQSGDRVALSSALTVLIGPNNAGKSSVMRETQQLLEAASDLIKEQISPKVVADYELTFDADVDSYIAILSDVFGERPAGQYEYGLQYEKHYKLFSGQVITESVIRSRWNTSKSFGPFAHLLNQYLSAEQRLTFANETSSFDQFKAGPSHPLHLAYLSADIENELDTLVKKAFGDRAGIVVNRFGGSIIRLHVGRLENRAESSPPSREYLQEITTLPALDTQGDGIRAFVGIALAVLTNVSGTLMIDEPEAFLHPPQARVLGEFLVRKANAENIRIVLATHSSSLLSGVLTSSAESVSVARIARNVESNRLVQLPPEKAASLFSDSLLRYFNITDGMFSSGLVLCESDGDCTYYRAVSDSIERESDPGLHFAQVAGKNRISRVVALFRELRVPVAAIFDIDLLQSQDDLAGLSVVLGLDPSFVEERRSIIQAAITSNLQVVQRGVVKQSLNKILDEKTAQVVDQNDIGRLRAELPAQSGWKTFKKAGHVLLEGASLLAFEELYAVLAGQGVFLVKQGELERFHPLVPAKVKSEWLRDVLEQKLYETSDARSLIVDVERFLVAESVVVTTTDVTVLGSEPALKEPSA